MNGHQAAKLIDQALMGNFRKRVLYMAMQACLSKRTLLAGEMVGDSTQPTRGIFARCALETDLQWVVLNLVGGANACLREFQRMWQAMETT